MSKIERRGTSLPTPYDWDIPSAVRHKLAQLSPASRRQYRASLRRLARHLGVSGPAEALALLAASGPVRTMQLVTEWREAMLTRPDVEGGPLAPATVAGRLAALRAIWKMLFELKVVDWPLSVASPKATVLRDTRGPGVDAVRAMIHTAGLQVREKALRDVPLVALLGVCGLRRQEVANARAGHFDYDGRRLRIVGKGKSDWQWVSLPPVIAEALRRYLQHRDARPDDALFENLNRPYGGSRALTGQGMHKIVSRLAKRAGIEQPVSPHRLRHTAITSALEQTDGNVREVRLFSRHEKVDTVMVYDDERRDPAGKIAGLVAAAIGEEYFRVDEGARGDGSAPGAVQAVAPEAAGTAPCSSEGPGSEITEQPRATMDVFAPIEALNEDRGAD